MRAICSPMVCWSRSFAMNDGTTPGFASHGDDYHAYPNPSSLMLCMVHREAFGAGSAIFARSVEWSECRHLCILHCLQCSRRLHMAKQKVHKILNPRRLLYYNKLAVLNMVCTGLLYSNLHTRPRSEYSYSTRPTQVQKEISPPASHATSRETPHQDELTTQITLY